MRSARGAAGCPSLPGRPPSAQVPGTTGGTGTSAQAGHSWPLPWDQHFTSSGRTRPGSATSLTPQAPGRQQGSRAISVATGGRMRRRGSADLRGARWTAPLTWGTWSRLKCRVRRAQLLSRWPERGRQGVLGSKGSSAPHSPQAMQGGCRHWPGAFSWHRCPGGHWVLRASGRPASRQGFRPHHTWAHADGTRKHTSTTRGGGKTRSGQ